jgi:site-specific recombinase XerD
MVSGTVTRRSTAGSKTWMRLRRSSRSASAFVMGPGSDRLSYELTSRLFRKYRRLAKLPESLTFHSLRKTYGTILASGGVPIRSIQKLLGHSDVRITAEIYADVLSVALRKQVEGAFGSYSGED